MNGIIYGIKDLSSDEIIYIGSTTNLNKRKVKHRYDCFTKKNDLLVYNYIREKTDREHFDECFTFEVLYSGEFETRQELRVKENKFIKDKEPQCNQYKAFQTDEELKEYRQEYYKTEKWREHRREYFREYNKTEKGREYKREYMREWRRSKKLAQESKKFILNNENNIK